MRSSKFGLLCLATLGATCVASCADDEDEPNTTAGASGKTSGGSAGASSTAGAGAGKGGTAGSSSGGGGLGGSSDSGGASLGGAASEAGQGHGGADSHLPEGCGDPSGDGVVIFNDITADTTWTCPIYTLTQPIYVHSTSSEPVVLRIEPGVTIRGIKGIENVKLPGALVVTRSARIEAVGEPENPIVFTTSEPSANAGPGSWGGLVLLGQSPVSAPEGFDTPGKPAGELYFEGLPKTDLALFGRPKYESTTAGAGGEGGAGGAGGAGGVEPVDQDPAWNCGKLQYVRIAFSGFKAGAAKELNGLTIAGCGSDTLIDHVQVHRSSDDGIEIFGGSVNLSYVVLTGNQDDSLDWDQGWQGKAQFVAIQSHDDADSGDSCGIEANGFPNDHPVLPAIAGEPSEPRLFNVTMILSQNTQRGIRFRVNSRGFIGNAILASHTAGVPLGLIDIEHAQTADNLRSGRLALHHSILRGVWPDSGETDSEGTLYLEQDYFTGAGAGAEGNDVIAAASELWLNAFNTSAPDWVPAASSAADESAMTPSDLDGSTFFDNTATYRGAFEPGGDDWTAGWTSYP
jgi:hypothetical protein